MQCAACGTANPAGAKFCVECGARLAGACPTCGAPVTAGQRFCAECGNALGTPPPASAPGPEAAPPAAERRVCSILFCDLVGFTVLSESRDPEAVRELLSRYFDTARTIVARYGGVVEKFIGDAVMAVWGTPTTTEDDAERAVRAALELIDAVAGLGAEVGAPGLAARAGVVTGQVAVTLGASGEGMVAGDAVNTAARFQTAAERGQVLVDETTARRGRAAIEFVGAGTRVLKGKQEPVRLWRAVRVLAGVGGLRRIDGLEAPLIGRDVELRLIKDLFHATVARQSPRLLLVTGAAGSGKTRLGWEFEKYIDGIADAVLWHRGRCLSYGDGVAFWAVAEIVRHRLGIAEEDPAEVALPKLLEGLEQRITEPAERAYVGLRLGRLLGLPHPADTGQELSREELFAGWRTWLVRLADTGPVVWLIEDLQNADVALLQFLDHLLDWARTAPIYLVGFARPELDERHPEWSGGRNRTKLVLDPLDDASMRQLLDALVPGMPEAATRAIAAQARGIPLFAIETIRSLIDRDIVQPQNGVYRLVGELGELDVPDSLRALLAARLDHLDPELRSLVADAAVLGDRFPAEALAAIANRPDDAVRDALRELVRRELLTVTADPLSPQRGAYRFASELLRRVAYETLSRRDRKARHLAVAEHLRATFANDGEEVADVIARHLLDALATVPEDADAETIRGQAVVELVRAGDRARATGAPGRAADDYRQAAEQERDPVAAAGLWERAAAAAEYAADYEEAVADADRGRQRYAEAGDRRAAARCDTIAGLALFRAGKFEASRTRLTAALEVLREDPDLDTLRALRALAGMETFSGSPDGERLSEEAVALAEALEGSSGGLAEALMGRGIWHSFAGHRARAIAYFREAARVAETAGDYRGAAIALGNLGEEIGAFDSHAAADAAREALDLARRAVNRTVAAFAASNLAESLLALGRWDEADAVLTDADAEAMDIPFPLVTSARLAALRGDATRARRFHAGLLALGSENPEVHAETAALRAAIAEAEGDEAGARAAAEEALGFRGALTLNFIGIRWTWPAAARLAHEAGDADAERALVAMLREYPDAQLAPLLRAERSLAEARSAPDGEDAGERFAAAVAAVRASEHPFHLAHALVDEAVWHSHRGDPERAGALLDEAEAIGTRLVARPLLTRIQRQRVETLVG